MNYGTSRKRTSAQPFAPRRGARRADVCGFMGLSLIHILGEGDSNFYKSMENLKAIGFHGDILIENFYTESKFGMNKFDDIFGLVSKDINTLKQIFDV